MPRKPSLQTVVLALQKRVEELEKRPDILSLNPEDVYVITIPEETLPADFDALTSVIQKYPNVVLLAANDVKFIRVT